MPHTTAWHSPSLSIDSATDWLDVANFYGGMDEAYATTVVSKSSSNTLSLYDFGFTIPEDATILGVEIQSRFAGQGIGTPSKCSTTCALLHIVNGAHGSQGEYLYGIVNNPSPWLEPYADMPLPISGDPNWNATLTPADINDSYFGVQYTHANGTADSTDDSEAMAIFDEHVRMRVIYADSVTGDGALIAGAASIDGTGQKGVTGQGVLAAAAAQIAGIGEKIIGGMVSAKKRIFFIGKRTRSTKLNKR